MFGVSVISGEARGDPKGEAWGEASGESRGEVVEAHDLGVVLLLFVGLSGVRNVDSVAGGGHDTSLVYRRMGEVEMKLVTQFFLVCQTFYDYLAHASSCAALANTLVSIRGSDTAVLTSLNLHDLELRVQLQESHP